MEAGEELSKRRPKENTSKIYESSSFGFRQFRDDTETRRGNGENKRRRNWGE
jgi:hypothetical protein